MTPAFVDSRYRAKRAERGAEREKASQNGSGGQRSSPGAESSHGASPSLYSTTGSTPESGRSSALDQLMGYGAPTSPNGTHMGGHMGGGAGMDSALGSPPGEAAKPEAKGGRFRRVSETERMKQQILMKNFAPTPRTNTTLRHGQPSSPGLPPTLEITSPGTLTNLDINSPSSLGLGGAHSPGTFGSPSTDDGERRGVASSFGSNASWGSSMSTPHVTNQMAQSDYDSAFTTDSNYMLATGDGAGAVAIAQQVMDSLQLMATQQQQQLSEIFHSIDTSHEGFIQRTELRNALMSVGIELPPMQMRAVYVDMRNTVGGIHVECVALPVKNEMT